MDYWNYRIGGRNTPRGLVYHLYEVFYAEKGGKITGISENPVTPGALDYMELQDELELVAVAREAAIVDYDSCVTMGLVRPNHLSNLF